VVVENEWGWIEEINLTFIVVRLWDKRRLVLPTTYFLEKPFQNWTRTTADIIGSVFLVTDYNVPLQELRKELTRLLEGTPMWDKKVNVLQVTDSKENTMESRILVSARNSPTA
jgi:small-conductance mechanosensitive channel